LDYHHFNWHAWSTGQTSITDRVVGKDLSVVAGQVFGSGWVLWETTSCL